MPGGSIGQLFVDISARLAGLEKGFAQAQSRAAIAGAGISRALTGTLLRYLSGAIIARGFVKAIKGAAQLNETLNKVNVVFGPAADQIKAQADDLAGRFGLIKGPLLDAAAGIGLIGQAAGQSQGAAAQMSNRLTKLAADASSFYDVPLDIALKKIQAGLVGQSRPLRVFGALLSEDSVKAEAMALGLARTSANMSQQVRVLARASLIEKGLARAHNDLERTASSSENQFRKFSGTIENLSVTFATTLLPVITEVVTGINEALVKLSGGFDQSKATVENFGSRVTQSLSVLGFIFRNLGDLWAVAALEIQEGAENVFNAFAVLPENLSRIAGYIAGNWKTLILDAISAVSDAYKNLTINLGNVSKALFQFFQTGKWEFDWTPLLEGFKATTEQLPELLQPVIVDLQAKRDEIINRIGEREAARAAALAAAAGGKGLPPGPQGGPPTLGKEKRTTITGVEEFAKGLLASGFGKEGVAEKSLAAQQKQVTVLEMINETNGQLKEQIANFIQGGNWGRGPRAVAVGPK